MIDEDRTMQVFGYYSYDLSPKSTKRIIAVCEGCGKYRNLQKASYRELCASCAHAGDKHWGYGRFGKNHPNHGKRRTEEVKQKMSDWYHSSDNPLFGKTHPNYGKRRTEEVKQKLSDRSWGSDNPFFGKHHTEEAKRLMSEAKRNPSAEIRRKISENHADVSGSNNPFFGKHHTEEAKQRMSEAHIGLQAGKNNPMHGVHLFGAQSPRWQGGITPWRTALWRSSVYQNWRKDVFERDNYTCRMCNIRGGDLEAHHIHPVRDTKNTLAIIDINNGIALCKACHNETKGHEYEFIAQFEAILRGG